jgi:O-methyltransferase involved in polyketide biosynthesis
MQSPESKLKLEPTAALVMKWALPLYKNNPAIEFVNRLDLSSGIQLYEKCQSVCDWYGEVILNRKSFIKHLIEQVLIANEREYQVIILAAGKSPLAIELLAKHEQKIRRIFELDISGMSDKQCLYHQLFPEYSNRLECVTVDISRGDILSILNMRKGFYRKDIPSIIVIEGISYYLQSKVLKTIIDTFSKQNESHFIIEYLVPDNCIKNDRKYIPLEIFGIIHDDCALKGITTYTGQELQTYFQSSGGLVTSTYTMTDMELYRTGVNTYFKDSTDGWIECITGVIGTLSPK